MATFGHTTDDNDNVTVGWNNYKLVDIFTLPESGNVTKLSLHLSNSVVCNIKAVIYQDSSGPTTLLGMGTEVAIPNPQTEAWIDLPFGTPVALTAGNYWLGFIGDATATALNIKYKSTAGSAYYGADTYADGASDPFGASTATSREILVYATYTPASDLSSLIQFGIC
jgi:hypothetical protein